MDDAELATDNTVPRVTEAERAREADLPGGLGMPCSETARHRAGTHDNCRRNRTTDAPSLASVTPPATVSVLLIESSLIRDINGDGRWRR